VAAGVPVVAFNVDDHATPNARLAAVNQRLYEAGRTLGQNIAPLNSESNAGLTTKHAKDAKNGGQMGDQPVNQDPPACPFREFRVFRS
jgi:hypothetical protein